jgi:hypothetical protein
MLAGMSSIWRTMVMLALAAAACARPAVATPTVPPAARSVPSPGGRAVLLELFTSQGCSSCPAADELLAELPALGLGPDKVVALAYHVDYWDDLGWRDPFASPRHSERQRRYNRSGKLRGPGESRQAIDGSYTPQMVIAGAVHFPGGRREVALAEIRRAAAAPSPLDVALAARAARDGDGDDAVVVLSVRALVRGSLIRAAQWQVHAALTASHVETRVLAGENQGRALREASVVRALAEPVPLASALEGNGPARIVLTKPADLAWADVTPVIFVQSTTTLAVTAALALPSPTPSPAR